MQGEPSFRDVQTRQVKFCSSQQHGRESHRSSVREFVAPTDFLVLDVMSHLPRFGIMTW